MNLRRSILLAFAVGVFPILSQAQSPVPFVNQPLVPDSSAAGAVQLTITVNGTGFVSGSVVSWNGQSLQAQFVNDSQLKAVVPAANVSSSSTASVRVINPLPGGGISNLAFFTVTPYLQNSITLASPSPSAPGYPAPVGVGDFNGDDKLDLVVASGNASSGLVTLLLNDGKGHFSLSSSVAIGAAPTAMAVGDFNGDGKLDVVVNNNDATVSILLGDGSGHLTLVGNTGPNPRPVGCGLPSCPIWLKIAVGDFNADGKLDLALEPGGMVYILLGDGTGKFVPGPIVVTNLPEGGIVTGDFNGDGNLDLALTGVVPDGGGVSILLGDGSGNFTVGPSLPLPGGTQDLVVGDFNGDGNLDLAVSGQQVSTLLGDGTGNFTVAFSENQQHAPSGLAVGDFNGDGKLDLVVGNESGPAEAVPGSVSIFVGDGDGGLKLATVSGSGISPSASGLDVFEAIAIGDFNGDGLLDVAVGNQSDSGLVSLLLQVASDFDIGAASGSPSSTTLSPGQSAHFNLAITPSGSFAGAVNLACSISPAVALAPTCTLPSSVNLSAGKSTPITLTVSTISSATSGMIADSQFPGPGTMVALIFLLAPISLLLFTRRLVLPMVFILLVGCGGNSTPLAGPGTAAGNYTIRVTASAGNLSHSTNLRLVVQ